MDTTVRLFNLELKNPLMPASGCYGFGREASCYADLSRWGALVTKGLTLEPREGNKAPRLCETASGMLNSVGLQNPGLDAFMETELPFMEQLGPPIIANVAGAGPEDYQKHCKRLEDSSVFAIELNLSCPNVKAGCMAIGADPVLLKEAVAAAREVSSKPLLAKLTPNVTDIASLAVAAVEAGADGISLVNTFLGMAVDLRSRRPVLRNNTGGLSGPAIKPLALRMCEEVCRAVSVPVLAMGGITTARDVLEFIMVGASAVQLGLFNCMQPTGLPRLIAQMEALMEAEGIASLDALRGSLERYQ